MKQTANYLLWTLMLTLAPGLLLAQRTITGTVTDGETSEPLVGVTVLVVDQSVGARTMDDGTYRLELPAGATQLRFSYLGYTPQIVSIGEGNVINVGLEPDILSTDEVVVIGYGTVKKEDATGSVQSVNAESFNQGAINSPQELVAGKVAGVQITQGAGPGDGAAIRIRGGSSLSASNDPLIVIDGVPVFNDGIAGSRNPLNIINPNDIESFTVLKDASATAIYGSRASNGVILITTKKGALGKKVRVGYNGNFSVSNRANEIPVHSADEFRALINDQFEEGHPARAL
ncbi:MAG: TonB-dependent receptor plug domain-containing protein, partial [Bacteroidota bacterium]